jgi:hypothetical protein
MTFMPVAGMVHFEPVCWDRMLGEKWQMAGLRASSKARQ